MNGVAPAWPGVSPPQCRHRTSRPGLYPRLYPSQHRDAAELARISDSDDEPQRIVKEILTTCPPCYKQQRKGMAVFWSKAHWRTNLLLAFILCLGLYLVLLDPTAHGSLDQTIDIDELEQELDGKSPIRIVTYKSPLDKTLFESQDDPRGWRGQHPRDFVNPVASAIKYHHIWSWADDVINRNELFPEGPEVEKVLKALTEARIVHVDVLNLGEYESGTSEKWLVTLEGGQKAMMKIIWEEKGKMKPDAMCNYGYEMPSSEITGFHLHRILGFRNTPYVSGRVVDLTHEIYPVASPAVARQILFKSGNETCVVGKCYFCKTHTSLCPANGKVEVSMAYWVGRKLKLYTGPPKYMPFSTPRMDIWGKVGFNNKSYCQEVRKTIEPYEEEVLYFDLFDFAVLDTLMFHYDSKHYMVEDDTDAYGLTVRLDHGRAFCASDRDEIDVFLAPITQCCTLRASTWQKLQRFNAKGSLSKALKDSLARDPLDPVMSMEWFPVLERRLAVIRKAIEKCAEANEGMDKVLVMDSQ